MIRRRHRRRPGLSAEQVAVVCALGELLTVLDDFGVLALAVCAPALLALPLRRRLPLTALCATLPAVATWHLLLPAMITMCVVASSRSPGRTRLSCGLLCAAALCPWPLVAVGELTPSELLGTVEAAGLLSIGPTALGLLAGARAETEAQLVRLRASREREQQLGAERAVIRERARLARDMHDTISHHVSIIVVQAGALRSVETDPAKRADAESIREHGVRALEELRDMVGVLRGADGPVTVPAGPPRLADLPGLVADSMLDITADLPALAERSWRPGLETAAYRIVQEALNNVRKHAPGASVALSAAVAEDRGSLVLEVRNGPPGQRREGPGETTGGGHGLVGLRERAEQLGGRLTASPSAGGGFLVRAVLPL
ncbi:sensor histidine kinase [Streptomyces bacillaris]|uniref:sensor histidine kinase n=1 Tax=Streptomyces bacillaris TaxID=68179 RepID=UPI0036F57585